VENVIGLLRGESGRIGNLDYFRTFVKLEPSGEALVVGDLHGDLESLISILQNSGFTQKMTKRKDATLIFLGRLRRPRRALSRSLLHCLRLKLAFPEQVVLLRGNHEGPEDLMASPHDLPTQFQARFKENWTAAYSAVRECLVISITLCSWKSVA
jgi:hypothetical protein